MWQLAQSGMQHHAHDAAQVVSNATACMDWQCYVQAANEGVEAAHKVGAKRERPDAPRFACKSRKQDEHDMAPKRISFEHKHPAPAALIGAQGPEEVMVRFAAPAHT